MRKNLFAALISLFAVFGVTAAANAAYTKSAVNLRSGPGTGYHVILTMHKGAHVRVLHCGHSWCRVRAGGHKGWMAKRYIGYARKHSGVKSYHHSHGHYHHSHGYGHKHHSHSHHSHGTKTIVGGLILYLLHKASH